eukprot:g6836.t1
MENILELVAVHGSQVETVLQDVEKTDVKQMKKKKSKTQYICGSGCVLSFSMDGYTMCWSDDRTSISCPSSPRNYSCEYERYNDLIQKNGEACWSFSGGNCAAHPYTQEGGIRQGKSQFEELEYLSKYWYCEASSNGPLPKIYHRFYTVSTGSSGTECQGFQASFGVDLNDDEIFVAPAAMSSAGIPLSCGSMDETTGCSECSLLPIEFLDASFAKVLGADLNSAIAFFLMLLMVIIILKEIVGLFVIAFVIFAQEKSVRDFNFVEIARDSIVGLVLIFILSIIDFSYLGRSLTSDNDDDDDDDDSKNSSRLVEPYPKIMLYVWMPLEYFELFVELIFSILWIQNLYSDAFYDIPKGREVDVILMSWAFAMFDLFMFRVPMLVNNMLSRFSCCNKKKKDDKMNSACGKIWNVFMFSLYVSLALIGTVVYIVMYNLRYDYCWEMDDGVSTQGFGSSIDFYGTFCESSWTWCSYTALSSLYWDWYAYDVEMRVSTGEE